VLSGFCGSSGRRPAGPDTGAEPETAGPEAGDEGVRPAGPEAGATEARPPAFGDTGEAG
jgi:hypothetical protein